MYAKTTEDGCDLYIYETVTEQYKTKKTTVGIRTAFYTFTISRKVVHHFFKIFFV